MERTHKNSATKGEISEGEEDFESADEGEEESPPSLATSAESTSGTAEQTMEGSVENSQEKSPERPSLQENVDDVKMEVNAKPGEQETRETPSSETLSNSGSSSKSTLPPTEVESSEDFEQSIPRNNEKSGTGDIIEESREGKVESNNEENRKNPESEICETEPNDKQQDNDTKGSSSPENSSVDSEIKQETKSPTTEASSEGATKKEGSPQDQEHQPEAETGWGWGSWGSVLSQATASVTSGLSHVIESVETSLGIPEPSEIAHKVTEEEKKAQKSVVMDEPVPTEPKETGEGQVEEEESLSSALSAFGLSNVMRSKLVTDGLEALEFIGKKTMDVISDGDPGLRKKREALSAGNGPNLSQMLREAKEEAERKAAHQEQEKATKNVNFSTEFDQHQGLAHLEALEILAKESEHKVESQIIDLPEEQLNITKPVLRTLQDLLRANEDEEDDEAEEQDFSTEIQQSLESLHLTHIPDKITHVATSAKEWIKACVKDQDQTPGSRHAPDIYKCGISTLAELTARTVEQFHKIAEVILLLGEKETSAIVRAQGLKRMTGSVCTEVSVLATHFAGCLNTAADDSEDPEGVSTLITSLYLESSECARYVQHAFELLGPVLQLSSLGEKTEES